MQFWKEPTVVMVMGQWITTKVSSHLLRCLCRWQFQTILHDFRRNLQSSKPEGD